MKLLTTRPLSRALLCGALFLSPAAALAGPGLGLQESGAAAPAAPAVELPAARQIIDRFIAVSGLGADKANSRRIKGRVEVLGMEVKGTFEMVQARPDRQVLKMELAGAGTVRHGFDGKVAWMHQEMMGPMLLEGAAHEQMKLSARFDYEAHDAAHYEVMETVGRTTFDDRDCYKVRLVAKPWPGQDTAATLKLRESFVYYEVESGLLAGSENVQDGPMGATPSTSRVSKYAKFGDVQVPTRNVQKGGGIEFETLVDSVTFDDVKPEELALPTEVAALVPKEG